MNILTQLYKDLCLRPREALWLLALMCATPFLVKHHMQPLTSFSSEWLAFALGVAALASLLRSETWQPFRLPVVALVPLGLLGVVLAQAGLGLVTYPQQAVLVALYLLWAALLVVLGATLRRELGMQKVATTLALALLAGGVISALIVFSQVAGINPLNLVARKNGYYANLAQLNHLANYLALALASLLYLFSRERVSREWGAILAPALLIALALTGQRSGWLYLLALAILGLMIKRRLPGAASHQIWVGTLWLIPLFAAIQLLLPLLPATSDALMPAQRLVDGAGGSSVRLEFWRMAWDIFTRHPLLGVGFYQFNWESFLLADTNRIPLGSVSHAHNLFMQLLAETGLVGTLPVVAGFAYWLYRAWKAPLTPERWWMLALLGVLFIHSMLEFPLWYAYFLGIAAVLLGMEEQKTLQAKLDLGPLALAGILAFGILSLGNTAYHYARMESWVAWVQQGKATEAQWNAIRHGLVVMRDRTLLTPQVDMLIAVSMPLDRTHLEDKIALSSVVMRTTPDDSVAFRHIKLLALAGRNQQALELLNHAMSRYPDKVEGFVVSLLPLMNREPLILPVLNAALKRMYRLRQAESAAKHK